MGCHSLVLFAVLCFVWSVVISLTFALFKKYQLTGLLKMFYCSTHVYNIMKFPWIWLCSVLFLFEFFRANAWTQLMRGSNLLGPDHLHIKWQRRSSGRMEWLRHLLRAIINQCQSGNHSATDMMRMSSGNQVNNQCQRRATCPAQRIQHFHTIIRAYFRLENGESSACEAIMEWRFEIWSKDLKKLLVFIAAAAV